MTIYEFAKLTKVEKAITTWSGYSLSREMRKRLNTPYMLLIGCYSFKAPYLQDCQYGIFYEKTFSKNTPSVPKYFYRSLRSS